MLTTEAPPWAVDAVGESSRSILTHDAWLEFNRQCWGVTPERVHLAEEPGELPAVETVYYLNKRGQIWRPPLVPYMPLSFHATPTRQRARLHRQWLAVGRLLAEDMQRRGMVNSQFLAPGVCDLRPWQWCRFQTGVRYTFRVDLPLARREVDSAVRRHIARADRAGYVVERSVDFDRVYAALSASEDRQGFTYHLPRAALDLARAVLGDELFQCYICYAPRGEPAAATAVLVQPGGEALGWVIGTVTEHLRSGATQLLIHGLLEALTAAGAIRFDFLGANLPTVASFKVPWGAKLVPYHTIEAPNLRGLARQALGFWRYIHHQSIWPAHPDDAVRPLASGSVAAGVDQDER